jgi:hypothetical protein
MVERRKLTEIFTDTLAALMGTTDPDLGYEFDASVIRPTVILGGNPTAAGTLSRALQVSAAGFVRTDAGVLGSGVAVGNTAASWSALAIGTSAWFTTGSIAGNATAALPNVAPAFGDSIFQVEQILHTLDTDATVASRIPTLTILAGMPSIVTTLNDFSQVGATSTANENSKMFVPRGPAVVKLNDNGTFSDGATSPLPMFIGDAGLISVVVASGVAGDAHSLSALVRRLA